MKGTSLYSEQISHYARCMPELPEVETVRRGLERTIVGKTVASVDVRVPKMFQSNKSLIDSALVGAKVLSIDRRAKILLVNLSSDYTLAIHLKMTGQLIVANGKSFVGGHPEKAYDQPLPHKHTHITIKFTDGATLYYNDLRKFGWMKLLQKQGVGSKKQSEKTVGQFLDELKLGPEPLGEEFTLEYFSGGLNRRTSIKQLLLDQKFIAGIGNIYADEALFAAKVLPIRAASSLSKSEVKRLFDGVKDVLKLGIKHGGTTMNTYRNVDGTHGGMRDHLKVYGREGEVCLRCSAIIQKKKIGQRSASFCSGCQR